jgi:hypothetical protein
VEPGGGGAGDQPHPSHRPALPGARQALHDERQRRGVHTVVLSTVLVLTYSALTHFALTHSRTYALLTNYSTHYSLGAHPRAAEEEGRARQGCHRRREQGGRQGRARGRAAAALLLAVQLVLCDKVGLYNEF